MKVKDVKHKVTLDDFEHRLLIGCVNATRTMYLEQNKPTEDVDDLLVKIIKSPSKKESMKDEFVKNIGVWGQRHYAYLKKHSPTVINVMRMNGTLEQYLRDIDQDAQEMSELLMKQYTEIEGITEQLKSANEIDWIRSMNSIRNRAEEIVLSEVIYN